MTLLIHDTATVQGVPLGDELALRQRVYRYAKNGVIPLNPGEVVQTARPNDAHSNMTCAAAAAGTKIITVTMDQNVIANEYKDGYIYINDEAGEGFVYDVVSHLGAVVTEPTDAVTAQVTLRDPLVVALTTSSQATLVQNLYSGVTPTWGEPPNIIAGVVPITVAANAYFWCQVRGPAAVKQEGGLFAGQGVQSSQYKKGSVAVAKQVVPIRQRTAAAARAGVGAPPQEAYTEAHQYQQAGIEQRFDYESQRTEPDEVLTTVSGKVTIPSRILGYCINPRVSEEFALVYLTIS
jgi:hypothetical protein